MFDLISMPHIDAEVRVLRDFRCLLDSIDNVLDVHGHRDDAGDCWLCCDLRILRPHLATYLQSAEESIREQGAAAAACRQPAAEVACDDLGGNPTC